MLNLPQPGRRLFSGHPTWVQAQALPPLLSRALAASSLWVGAQGIWQAGLLISSDLEKGGTVALGIIRILKKISKLQMWRLFQTKDSAQAFDWDFSLLVPPVHALRGSPAWGGRRRLPAPEALAHNLFSGASPRTCPTHSELSSAGCSKLRYEMLSWSMGCEVFAGFQPALEQQPPLACDRAGLPAPLQVSHRLWRGVFSSLVQHQLNGHYTNCAHWFSLSLVFVN